MNHNNHHINPEISNTNVIPFTRKVMARQVLSFPRKTKQVNMDAPIFTVCEPDGSEMTFPFCSLFDYRPKVSLEQSDADAFAEFFEEDWPI